MSVVLLNHGAADSEAHIEAFLRNIFCDREIIRLPGGPDMQRRLAGWIAGRRAPRVAQLYRYMGGGSPLVSYMRRQASQLEAALGAEARVHIGLRYYVPSIADGVAGAVADSSALVVAFPQYPQYSATTVGSVLGEFRAAVERVPGASGLGTVEVPPFGADVRYVQLLAARVRAAAASVEGDPTLLFSAHSIPRQFVEAGDPYPNEVGAQVRLIAEAAGFADAEVGYQSRSGPVRWLAPDVIDVADRLIAAGRKHLLVVPISFVQDHLETLVELDVQLADRVRRAGGSLTRVRPANGSEDFAAFSADLVREAVAAAL